MSPGIAKCSLGMEEGTKLPLVENHCCKLSESCFMPPIAHSLVNKIERDRTQGMSPEGRNKELNWPVSSLAFKLERIIPFRLLVAHAYPSSSCGNILLLE